MLTSVNFQRPLLTKLTQCRYLRRPALNTTQLTEGRRTGALGLKVGMLPYWDKWGERHAVTVVHIDGNCVLQSKTEETDGYVALQIGAGNLKSSRTKKSILGHCAKAGVPSKYHIEEFKVTPDALLKPGTQIEALHFVPGQLVDISGISKGKGYQGVMKKWGFGGGRATHGNSLSHRIPGSTGCRQDPGKVFKNKKMSGRMGNDKITVQNLKVLRVDPTRQLLYLKGAIPGIKGGYVRIVDAVKGPFYPSPPPFPTFIPDGNKVYDKPIDAPVKNTDVGIKPVPEDPY